MKGVNGILFTLRWAIRKPQEARQALRALPVLLVRCVVLRQPVLYICRYSGLGDVVCTLPSVKALKQEHPHSVVVYETRRHCLALVKHCRQVDVVTEENSLLTMLVQKLFKPKCTFQPLLPDEKKPPQPRAKLHLIEEFRRSFGLAAPVEPVAQLNPSARSLQQIRKRLEEQLRGRPFAVVHTGPTWLVKEWSGKIGGAGHAVEIPASVGGHSNWRKPDALWRKT